MIQPVTPERFSLNTATVRAQWSLRDCIEGCVRHGIRGIAPWRDKLEDCGVREAARMIAEAAQMLAEEEQALQLRYLQTLKEISNERTNTIVFPMPLELVEPILHLTGSFEKKKAGSGSGPL